MVKIGLLNYKTQLNDQVRTKAERLGAVLSQSRSALQTASVHFPGMRSLPFRTTVIRLVEKQKQLEGDLYRLPYEGHGDYLGWIGLAIAGGAAILSALGLSVYKQRQETKEIESRMELYDRLILEGHSTDEASRMAFNGGGGVGDALNKVILLAAIGAGVLVFIKMKK